MGAGLSVAMGPPPPRVLNFSSKTQQSVSDVSHSSSQKKRPLPFEPPKINVCTCKRVKHADDDDTKYLAPLRQATSLLEVQLRPPLSECMKFSIDGGITSDSRSGIGGGGFPQSINIDSNPACLAGHSLYICIFFIFTILHNLRLRRATMSSKRDEEMTNSAHDSGVMRKGSSAKLVLAPLR